MSMPQTLEDPVALEAVDDTAEDVVAPFVAIEGDQLSAEFSKSLNDVHRTLHIH